jgi:hypothetical protein
MTILDLIKSSMRIALGSCETPSAEEAADALQSLQLLLGEMKNNLLVAKRERQVFQTESGTASYTIADGGDEWDGNPPERIIEAYITDASGYDCLLDRLAQREYAGLVDKDSPGLPRYFYYENDTIYLYPNPDDAYNITIVSPASLMAAASTSETITIPNSYIQMLKYGLAISIAPEYGVQISQIVYKQYENAKASIERASRQKPSDMQFEMFNGDGGFYDITTDTYR